MVRDLTGQKFNMLTVLERNTTTGRAEWVCACDCGNTASVRELALIKGTTRSCGCLVSKANKARATAGGLSHTPEYLCWKNIKEKSQGSKTGHIPTTVDPRWQESFDNFYNDMGPRPTRKHRFTRIDPRLGFNKDNCYWKLR